MFELLDKYLRNNTTEEHYGVFERTIEILNDFQITDFEDYASPLILDEVDNQSNAGVAMTGVTNLAKQYLAAIVNMHEVQFNPEATHRQLNELASCLFLLQDYESKERIVELVTSDLNNSDIIAHLCALVGTLDYAQFIDIVYGCSDSFINRLRDESIDIMNSSLESTERKEIEVLAARLNDYAKFLSVTKTMASVKVSFGIPFLQPIDYYMADVRNTIRTLPTNTAAIELFGFALVSCSTEQEVLECYKDKLQSLFDDVDQIMRVSKTYRTIFDKFFSYQKQFYDATVQQA